MSHLMREELIRWRDGDVPEERDRILSHLASCKSCAAAYAEVVRTAPVQLSPTRFKPEDFVQRGYAARKSEKPSWATSLTTWKTWAAGFGAVAAILLVVLALPARDDGGVRGGTIEIVSTAAAGAAPSIEWKSGISANRFRVALVDREERVLFAVTTQSNQATLPADIAATLRPEAAYEWRVTALDVDGAAITTAAQPLAVGPGGVAR